MNHKFNTSIACVGATVLAACGGTETATTVNFAAAPTTASAATASSGYATAPGIVVGETYQMNSEYLNLSDSSGPSLQSASASITFLGGGAATLVLDGVNYPLSVTSGPYITNYTTTVNGHTIYVGMGSFGTNMITIYISDTYGGNVLSGSSIAGANADPANLPVIGTATYSGGISGAVYGVGTTDEFDGIVNFNIDFAASTIDGAGVLTDATTSASIGNFTMPSTSIVGNTFGTTPTVTLTTAGTTVDSAQIVGDFYGPTGAEIGGTIAVQGTNANGDMTLLGGFFAN